MMVNANALVAATLLAVTGAAPGDGPAGALLGGRVAAVATSSAGVVASSDRGVVWLDLDGRLRRRFWSEPTALARGRRPRPRPGGDLSTLPGLSGDDDFGDIDLPDEAVDPDELDPFSIDAGPEARRRSASPASRPAVRVNAVAAAARALFVARGDGLWRVTLPEGAATRVLAAREPGARAVAVEPAGGTVAVVAERRLWLSRDGGTTFADVGATGDDVRAIAVNAAGAVFVLGGSGRLERVPANGDVPEVLGGIAGPRAIDLVACGAETLALLRDGTVAAVATRSRGEAFVPLARAPAPFAHLTCGDGARAGEMTWALWSAGLATSEDRGATWTLRDDLPPSPLRGVAPRGGALWVATDRGLLRLEARPQAPHPAKGDLRRNDRDDAADLGGTLPTLRWWYAALPRLDLGVTIARTPTRRDLRVLLVATFAFDGRKALVIRETSIAAARVRRWLGTNADADNGPAGARAGPPVGDDADERPGLD